METFGIIIGYAAAVCMILGYLPQAITTIRTRDTEGIAMPIFLMMGLGSLQYDITEKVTASATYSQFRTYVSNYSGGTTPWDERYKYGQYISSNIFYKATSFFDVGLEYIWGRRVNYDNLKCADNRIQMAIQLSF